MRRWPLFPVAGLLLILGACAPSTPAGTQSTASAPISPQATVQLATPAPASATGVPAQPTPAPALATAVPPPAPAGPQRISFAPGATSGAVDGAVVRGTEQRYLLGAGAGQLMQVQIGALEHNAVFTVFAPDGRPLAGTEPGRDATDWSGTLPASGDYQIVIGTTRGNATFHLDVAITDPAPADQSIRTVDWNALLVADPALDVAQVEGRPYVRVRAADPGVGGHPLLDDIVYIDMDGNGTEEAAIPLNSGGTAGKVGVLIYRQAAPAPQLTAWQNGYKLGLQIEAGRLVVRNALYAGWEPNCCPSGFSLDTYTLQNGLLHLLAHREEGFAEAQAATVEHFYELLGQKKLMDAYALLADTEQAANPYDAWAAGFADTLAIQATATADPAMPNGVRVDLSATDRIADGGQKTQRYAGTWALVWGGAGRGWMLANPQIQAIAS